MKIYIFRGTLFLLVWFLIIALPYFQNDNSLISSFICFIAAGLFLYSVQLILQFVISSNYSNLMMLLILMSYLFTIFLLFSGLNSPYVYWSKLGAGNMVLDGQTIPFGDLAQLISAVNCQVPSVVGGNVCDPWGRLLNQNPLVIEIFRLLKFSNLEYVGLTTTVIFFFVIYLLNRKYEISNLATPLFLLSPVSILAIERGNELITLTLILVGFYFLEKDKIYFQFLGSAFLGCAAIFKIWPSIIIVIMVVICKHLERAVKIFMIAPIVYWAFNIELAQAALQVTQVGTPTGVSFGARFLFDDRILIAVRVLYWVILFIVILYLISCRKRHASILWHICKTQFEAAILVSTFVSYFCIWLFGQSFMYRMLVFLPALVVLTRPHNFQNLGTQFLVSLILLVSFTAKLQITLVLTSIFAIVVLYVAVITYLRWYLLDQGPKYHKFQS